MGWLSSLQPVQPLCRSLLCPVNERITTLWKQPEAIHTESDLGIAPFSLPRPCASVTGCPQCQLPDSKVIQMRKQYSGSLMDCRFNANQQRDSSTKTLDPKLENQASILGGPSSPLICNIRIYLNNSMASMNMFFFKFVSFFKKTKHFSNWKINTCSP